MKITLIPQRRDDRFSLAKSGEALILGGKAFDFSQVAEGAPLACDTLECDWFAGDIERIAGALHLTLVLPHGADAPHETLFPAPLILSEDGPVALPPYNGPGAPGA